MSPPLVKYEHDRLMISEKGMSQSKLDALLRFNEFHGNQYFDGIAKGIRFKQYVGIIQVDGLTIEILPKVDRDHDESTWRDVLIQMLKATGRMKVQTTGDAHVKRQNMNLLEIYFELYLSELQYLLRGGLVKKYRKETGNVKSLKGKLDFAGNIRYNLIHKERFYTAHQVYDVNHKIHQVLAVALEIVGQFSRGTCLNDFTRRIQLDFPEVSKIKVDERVLTSLSLDRKTKGYERALELARLIILNYSPDIKSGKEKMLSLLFDMNVLWEEYVIAMLRKECRGSSFKVNGQESKKFWGASRTIRPDIVLQSESRTYILDTKWKRPLNDLPSIEDLRQMYTYSRFWNTEKVLLLYPGQHKGAAFTAYHNTIHDKLNHQCKVAFVNVLDAEHKLSKTLAKEILRELEEGEDSGDQVMSNRAVK